MKVTEKTVTFAEITPDEGKYLYDGETLAQTVAYAPVDQVDKWSEITEAEATIIKASQEAEAQAAKEAAEKEAEAQQAEQAAEVAGETTPLP